MGHAVLQPLRVGLSRFVAYMNWRVLKDQPYGVVIEPCPAKRLTPMGLLAGESARGLCDFRWEVGAFIGAAGCDGVIGGRDCMVFCGFIR